MGGRAEMREIEVFGDTCCRKDGEHVFARLDSRIVVFCSCWFNKIRILLKVPLRVVSLSVFLLFSSVWISGPSNTSRKAERAKPARRLHVSLQWVMRLGMSLSVFGFNVWLFFKDFCVLTAGYDGKKRWRCRPHLPNDIPEDAQI